MAKYTAKVGEWITPSETSGSIQNTSSSVTIEVTSNAEANQGLTLAPMQIINFDGTVFVRSAGKRDATFTAVPFKVAAGGGGGGGGGSTYTLPTASASVKGGVKVGSGLSIDNEILSADKQVDSWKVNTSYKAGDLVIYNGAIYQAKANHTSGVTFNEGDWNSISSSGTAIKEWAANTKYEVGDIVISDNRLYKCVTAHTSGSSINVQAYWTQLLSVGLVESWTHSHFYRLNEVVTLNNGSIYRCLTSHVSSSNFFTDVAKWELLYSDLKYWKSNTYYTVGVSVVNDQKLYICKINHTSGTTFVDTNWILVNENDYSIPDWEVEKEYKENNVVYYYGTIYRAITDHTSSNFEADSVNWSIIYSDLENWQAGAYYKSGATVVYSNTIYKCKVDHKSASSFSELNWERIGGSTLSAWVAGKLYKVGDKIIYNNSLYTANTEHLSSTFSADVANWDLIYADIKTWQANTYYTIGVVVISGTKLYRCITSHTSETTFDVTEQGKWTEIGGGSSGGFEDWASAKDYEIGDIVVYNNILYKCITRHISSTSFTTDILKWNIFHAIQAYIRSWSSNTYYEKDQVVLYDGELYRCTASHSSSSSFVMNTWEKLGIIEDWHSDTSYTVNKLVVYNGRLYTCTANHTSSSSFDSDASKWKLESNVDKWTANAVYYAGQLISNNDILYLVNSTFTSGTTFDDTNLIELGNGGTITTWDTGIDYEAEDIVIYADSLYRCKNDHTSTTFDADITEWELVYADLKSWQNQTYYSVGVCVVDENRYIWRCIIAHTSRLNFDKDEKDNWEMLSSDPDSLTDAQVKALIANFDPAGDGLMQLDNWESNHGYATKQVVVYSNKLYRCKTAHTSGAAFDSAEKDNWEEIISGGGTNIDDWETGGNYIVGQFVIYHNKIYKCKTANADMSFDPDNWQEICGIGEYASGVDYFAGELVFYDNKLYRCKINHTSTVTFDDTKWDIMSGGTSVDDWTTATKYKVGNIVVRENNLYKCVIEHISTVFKVDIANWQKLDNLLEWKTNTDYFVGDFFYYDGNLYRVENDFTSTATFDDTDLETLGGTPLDSTEVQDAIDNFNPVLSAYQANREIYTTGERAVGIWVDGKTVYQKTYTGTTPATANSNLDVVVDDNITSISQVVSIDGSVESSSGFLSLNDSLSAGWEVRTWVSLTNKSIRMRVGTSMVGLPFVVTIKYTKA